MRTYLAIVWNGSYAGDRIDEVWTLQAKTMKSARRKIITSSQYSIKRIMLVKDFPIRHVVAKGFQI